MLKPQTLQRTMAGRGSRRAGSGRDTGRAREGKVAGRVSPRTTGLVRREQRPQDCPPHRGSAGALPYHPEKAFHLGAERGTYRLSAHLRVPGSAEEDVPGAPLSRQASGWRASMLDRPTD